MLYSCTHVAPLGIKGLSCSVYQQCCYLMPEAERVFHPDALQLYLFLLFSSPPPQLSLSPPRLIAVEKRTSTQPSMTYRHRQIHHQPSLRHKEQRRSGSNEIYISELRAQSVTHTVSLPYLTFGVDVTRRQNIKR